MDKKENITKILLLGETGVGKSSLGNYIIGEEKFITGGSGKSVTNKIEGEISERELYKDIYIIDTPGTQDSQQEDSKFLEKIKNNFKDVNCGIRAICLLLLFEQPRFTEYLQKQLYIYCRLFPIEDFWEHVCIIFSKAHYYTPESFFISTKQELESENGLVNEIINYIKQCTEKINDSEKKNKNFKKIKTISKLPVFYTDSVLKLEENRNMRTQIEISKLINWARKKGYIDYQNINKNKIDINYMSSERIEDIIINEEKFLENSKLKEYSKKYFAQYKKLTFHKDLIIIKDPQPYKIEEIKEIEMETQPILMTEINNYKAFKIDIKAVKSKKRIIENNSPGKWINIENPEKFGNSRIISTKKIEEKCYKKLINTRLEKGKTIELYNNYKIIKIFVDDIELKNDEKKINLYQEKRTKEIIVETTEKRQYDNKKKYCEDITKEKTLTEFNNGNPPIIDLKEISRKKRYFKILTFEGNSFDEENDYLIITKKIIYEREDEVDLKDNIISKGVEKQIGERIISTKEKKHIIDTNNKKYDYDLNTTQTNTSHLQPLIIRQEEEGDENMNKCGKIATKLSIIFGFMFAIGCIIDASGEENGIILVVLGVILFILTWIIFVLYSVCYYLCCC